MRPLTHIADPELGGLSTALDETQMKPRLQPLVDEPIREVLAIDIVKHKPGRRCSVAYLLEGESRRHRLFAKVFRSDRGATVFNKMHRLTDAVGSSHVLLPRPLEYFADIRLLVTEYIDGVEFSSEMQTSTDGLPARRAARAIAAIHTSGAEFTRFWSREREVANTRLWLMQASDDENRTRGLDLLARLAAVKDEIRSRPLRAVHRDFYSDQLFVCGDRIALLDLDDVRTADPALDVGNFVAHLLLRGLQYPQIKTGCERARRPFLDEYREQIAADEECNIDLDERLAFYEATSLLRLIGVYGVRDRWASTIPPLLAPLAEPLVEDLERRLVRS